MPYSAVQFASYEQFKKLFTNNGTVPLDTSLRLLAGALAGICSVCATYPLDLVRSRLSIISASIGSSANAGAVVGNTSGTAALIRQKELGVLGMTAKVFREEGGLRGLYRGIGPTAAG
jgi:solute carrier family 25 phosphate transporter 23/24/25/41